MDAIDRGLCALGDDKGRDEHLLTVQRETQER